MILLKEIDLHSSRQPHNTTFILHLDNDFRKRQHVSDLKQISNINVLSYNEALVGRQLLMKTHCTANLKRKF